MAAAFETVNRWSAPWAGLAWAVTWQSAVLVGLAAVVALFLRRSSPGLRYWLWQIVAIKVLLMPFWTMAVPMPFPWPSGESPLAAVGEEREEGEAAAAPVESRGGLAGVEPRRAPRPIAPLGPRPPEKTTPPLSWQSWLLIAWFTAIGAQFAVLAWQWACCGGCSGRPLRPPNRSDAVVGELAGQLGLRRAVTAVVTGADCSFFACGAWRPVLVLPKGLLATLDEDRLRQVLLHELAHVKRLDLVLGWPVEIVRRMYFFNPLVHWLAYRVRLERELACDQVAMTASGRSPSDYVETLVHVVAQASQPSSLKAAAISAGLDGSDGARQRKTTPRPDKETFHDHELRSLGHGGCAGPKAQLSTFWKRRLAMLPAVRRSSPRLGGGVVLLLSIAAA